MTPATSEDAVRAWAKGGIVIPWEGKPIEGLDLFFVRRSDGEQETGQGVVVHDGNVSHGQAAMREAVARGGQDASALAAYASYLLQRGGEPLRDGNGVSVPAAERALIKPPRLDGSKLEYWTYQYQIGAPKLLRTQVDLATLALTVAPGERLANP